MTLSLWALAVAVAGTVLLAAAGPAHRLGLPLGAAFTLMRWAGYVGLAGAVFSLGAMLWARRQSRRGAATVAAIAVFVGVVTAAVPYGWLRQAQGRPLIHDVTTDLENPPAFQAIGPGRARAANSLARAPEVAQLQRQSYPDLAPVTIAQPAPLVFDRARATAERLGWTIVAADRATGRIEATDTTRWFGFTDDIVVRLTPWGTGTRVDLRSVSRTGESDLGSNAKRIRTFLAALQEDRG
jgi:uncharacterized protein (DUF1499 family)